jgi:hypothetical protein
LDVRVWQVSAPFHIAKGKMQWQCEKLMNLCGSSRRQTEGEGNSSSSSRESLLCADMCERQSFGHVNALG